MNLYRVQNSEYKITHPQMPGWYVLVGTDVDETILDVWNAHPCGPEFASRDNWIGQSLRILLGNGHHLVGMDEPPEYPG